MRSRPLLLIALLPVAMTAAASSLERVPPVTHAATLKECGECHMTFQPALLPAGSWLKIMDQLDRHFGDDSRLPADTAGTIRAYLVAHAGSVGDAGLMRITEQRWFLEEHRFSPAVWQRPEITTKSNCPACHFRAEQGIYDDD